MASGRNELHRDRDFEERDSDFEGMRRGFTDSRGEYERTGNGDHLYGRWTTNGTRVREEEVVNGGRLSGSRGEYERTRKGDYLNERGALDRVRIRERGTVSVDKYERTREADYVYDAGAPHWARVREMTSVNDGHNMGSSERNHVSWKARESAEISTESGAYSNLRRSRSESPKVETGDEVLGGSKKRKFTPIVWDREDKEVSASSKIRASPSIGLPPPPPLPKSYRQSPKFASDGYVKISPLKDNSNESHSSEPSLSKPVLAIEVETHVSPVSDSHIDIVSPPQEQEQKQDDFPEKELFDNQDHSPAVNILSSRWAGNGDSPPDEGEIADEEYIRSSRNAAASSLGETSRNNKSPTPEYKELKGEGLEIRRGSSGSDEDVGFRKSTSVDAYSSDELEKDNYSQSQTDSDDESDKRCIPEPEAPSQRSVSMLEGCRGVDEYERLNRINEGTYGVVYRAKDKKTGEIVALKKIKMEKEREGFPLTALREINILLSFHHPSIVDVKEVVMGNNLDHIFMVMEYMEHDVKALMEAMKQPFSQSEVKCLMIQLLEGVKYLHDNWVLHRDLKTSNLLMNNQGELKICDFGLARQYGSPLKPYTHMVVTLWYRAPELLLGQKEYSTAIDMWSVGCIMAELLCREPLFNGKAELEQLDKIFRMLGTPNETIWPGFSKLPGVKVNFVKHQYNQLRKKFRTTTFTGSPVLSDSGLDLLNKLLTYDPDKRITAGDALNHEWFREVPLPKSKEFMPTFPAQNAQDRRFRKAAKSPDPLEELYHRELKKGGGLFG